MSIMEKELFFQWWTVDESRMVVFEYYSNACKYTLVLVCYTATQLVLQLHFLFFFWFCFVAQQARQYNAVRWMHVPTNRMGTNEQNPTRSEN